MMKFPLELQFEWLPISCISIICITQSHRSFHLIMLTKCFTNSFMIIFSEGDLYFILYIEQIKEILRGDQSGMYSCLVIMQELTSRRDDIGSCIFDNVDITGFVGSSEQQDRCSLYIDVVISNQISVHIVIQ